MQSLIDMIKDDKQIQELRKLREMQVRGSDERQLVIRAITKRKNIIRDEYHEQRYAGMIPNQGKSAICREIKQPTSTLNPDGVSSACQCGARHTSNPSYHMQYCPLRTY